MPVIYLHIPKTAGMSLRSYRVDQFQGIASALLSAGRI